MISCIVTCKFNRCVTASASSISAASPLLHSIVNQQQTRSVCKTIFIKNLSESVTAKDINDVLSDYGPIKVIKLFTKDGTIVKKNPFAMVCFKHMTSALAAYDELNSSKTFGYKRQVIEFSKYSSYDPDAR